jgi:hypothetical protein
MITRQEIEAIAIKRGYRLPHRTIENCIKNNDFFEMLSVDEMHIVTKERSGLTTLEFLKLSPEKKEEIRYNKALEILRATK